MNDHERLVARRGSQGDDWNWGPPPSPEPGQKPPRKQPTPGRPEVSRWLAAAASLAGRSGRWLGSLPAATLEFLRRLTPERKEPPAAPLPPKLPLAPPPPTTTASAAELTPPSEAPQAVADTKPESEPSPLPSGQQVAVPWSRITTARPKLALPAPAKVPEVTGPLVLFAALGLGVAIAIGAVIAVSAIGSGGDNGGIVGGVTATPVRPTLIPAVSSTPFPTQNASPTPIVTPTRPPSPSPSLSPSPSPTARPTGVPKPTPNSPQGAVSAALWANTANAWWFGQVKGDVARFEEGQDVPLMVQWDGAAGQTYWVRIVYDCAAGGKAAVDYLSGADSWGSAIINASHGPAKDHPDGAISVPDTQLFTPDDPDNGLFTLYGAKFPVLPMAPVPAGSCPGQRTMSLPVLAYGGPITLIGSGHLGTATAYGHSNGASSATVGISVKASVDGVGEATVGIDPSAIADVEH